MAFNALGVAQTVQSHLLASGRFTNVLIGEPKDVQDGDRFVAAIFNEEMSVVETTLTTAIELHVLAVRIYRNMLAEPQDAIEPDGLRLVSEVMDDFYGDFTLGGQVRNVDVAGQYGTGLRCSWGYEDVSGKWFRLADITLPLIVDSTTIFAE